MGVGEQKQAVWTRGLPTNSCKGDHGRTLRDLSPPPPSLRPSSLPGHFSLCLHSSTNPEKSHKIFYHSASLSHSYFYQKAFFFSLYLVSLIVSNVANNVGQQSCFVPCKSSYRRRTFIDEYSAPDSGAHRLRLQHPRCSPNDRCSRRLLQPDVPHSSTRSGAGEGFPDAVDASRDTEASGRSLLSLVTPHHVSEMSVLSFFPC